MILYQLVASGPLKHFDRVWHIGSRHVFRTRAAADAHEEEFKLACTEGGAPNWMATLERVDEVKIVELELEDGQ